MLIATGCSEDRFYVWVDVCGTGFDLDIRFYPPDRKGSVPHRRTVPLTRPLFTDNNLINRAAEVVKR